MKSFRNRREHRLQSPIELRFIDLFMIIVAALIFIVLSLSFISAFRSSERPEPLEVVTRSLPAAIQGYPYRLTLAGAGGVGPYLWRVVDGKLPEGLSLDQESGRVLGTPIRSEDTSFTVSLIDATNASANTTLALRVKTQEPTGEVFRATGSVLGLPAAVASIPYYFQLHADGASPQSWKLTSGELPPGLHLTPKGEITGALSLSYPDERFGKPFKFTVAAMDNMGRSVTQEVALQAQPQPSSSFLSYVGSFLLLIAKWGGPVLALNLIIILMLAFTGFRGGIAGESKGLIRKLKKLSRNRIEI